jgi:hypothetical protein
MSAFYLLWSVDCRSGVEHFVEAIFSIIEKWRPMFSCADLMAYIARLVQILKQSSG